MPEQNELYPRPTRELAQERKRLAPGPAKAFRDFSQSVFAEGALPARTKQLIAVAVAHVTQCPYCIRGHTSAALQQGARPEEIMEAIWVAAEMRAGAAYAHSALALDTIAAFEGERSRISTVTRLAPSPTPPAGERS
jgi:AhpD family alkylhydroperoxidase